MALDISALAAKGAALAFGLIGTGPREAVVFHLGKAAGVYDPATDTITPTGGADAAANVLPFKRKNQSPEGQQIIERKFTTETVTLLVHAAELAAGAVIEESDTVTRADGQEWSILLVQAVPAKAPAIWLVDVRR